MPYTTSGKCVYKKKPDGSRGKKVGCTEGSVKDYLAALHMHADESKRPMDMEVIIESWRQYLKEAFLKETTYRRGMQDPSIGSKAGPIAKIQQKLISLGDLPQIPEADYGIYGPKTVAAVKKFQRKVFPGQPGEHDGIVGTNTFGALSKTAGGFVVPPPSATTAKPKAPAAATQKKAVKVKPKKPKYFKGMKRPEMTFAKKGPTSAKMTPLKLIASGKLGARGELVPGGSGQEVEALKIWLVDNGFFKPFLAALYDEDATVLDYYDDKTEAAVKKYQTALKLKTTGEINQETAVAMTMGIVRLELPPSIRHREGAPQTKTTIYKQVFGTPNPEKHTISALIKNQADVVDQNYQKVLSNAATKKDAILSQMIGAFIRAVKAQGGTWKTAWRFYNSFLGLARATIKKKGYTEWDNKFKEFALDPVMSSILFSKDEDLDTQKIKRFISKVFDLEQLNAQMFAAHMKSGKTEFTKKEEKVLRYLGGPNSFLVFNLEKTTLSWVLACGRKSTGKGNCKPLKERNYNNLAEMIHPSDLVLKRWRATSGDLEVYKKIKGNVDKDINDIKDKTFKLQNKGLWPLIGKLEKAFRQIGKAQNADIRQARNLGPLPIGVYRVSDYQEKSHKNFEGHFSRNMSKQINKQLGMFKDPEERKEFLKLMKKFNFVPTRARDIKTTVGAGGKRYRGRKPASWNVRTLTSAAYAWGAQRMWLTKLNVPDAKARKRTGFSIHGGAAFGSAGCLDLGPAMGNFSSFYKKAVGNADILLVSTTGELPNRVSKKHYLGIEKGGSVEGATV